MPIEISLLATGLELMAAGVGQFHGFRIAREIKERDGARRAPAYGTLYRALDRMADMGLLESDWEDPLIAAEVGRPRRRFYRVTAAGESALAAALTSTLPASVDLKKGLAPS